MSKVLEGLDVSVAGAGPVLAKAEESAFGNYISEGIILKTIHGNLPGFLEDLRLASLSLSRVKAIGCAFGDPNLYVSQVSGSRV